MSRCLRRANLVVFLAVQADLKQMDNNNLHSLESHVDELITECDELRAEIRALRMQQSNLMAERASLIEKSELARTRVEAMIERLKAMEGNG